MADISRYSSQRLVDAESLWLLVSVKKPNLMRDIPKQMEASPPYLPSHWMSVMESCVMMGLLIQGPFELLLGGVSHITHKALVLIAALCWPECLSLVMDGGGERGGRG